MSLSLQEVGEEGAGSGIPKVAGTRREIAIFFAVLHNILQ